MKKLLLYSIALSLVLTIFGIGLSSTSKNEETALQNKTITKTVKNNTNNATLKKNNTDIIYSPKADFYYLYLSANIDLRENRLDSAEKKFSQLAKKYPDNTDIKLALAKVLAFKSKPAEAMKEIDKVIKQQPDNYEAYRQKGLLYIEQYQKDKKDIFIEKAKRAFLEVIKLNPDDRDPFTLRVLSIIYLESNQTDKAQHYLEKLIKVIPDSAIALSNLEKIYQKNKDTKALLKLYTIAAENMPFNINLKLKLADVAFRLKRYDIVQNALNDVLNVVEDFEESSLDKRELSLIYWQLGFIDLRKNNLEKAQNWFLKSRDIQNRMYTTFYIIITLIQKDDYETARKELDIALKEFTKDKNYNEFLILNTQLLNKEGKLNEALNEIEKLIDKHPKNTEFKIQKAGLLYDNEIYEKSREYLEEVYKKHPAEPRIIYQLGASYERLKNYDKAEKLFQLTLKLDPNNSAALNYLGYMWAEKGIKLKEAELLIKKALELDPTNSAFLDSLGWVYYQLKDYAKARYYLEKAISEGVTGADMYDHMGDLYYAIDMIEEALYNWKKAITEEDPNIDYEKIDKKIQEAENLLNKK